MLGPGEWVMAQREERRIFVGIQLTLSFSNAHTHTHTSTDTIYLGGKPKFTF
jgi:hypothetical protein